MSDQPDGAPLAGIAPAAALRRGERWRAPYAAGPAGSRGRIHAEPDSSLRSAFQRDRDRIIHSNAFRRLKHKAQVFVGNAGDHFRTRLTHTIEVAQIARSIAVPLGLDEDLAEAVALAHDLGHAPFGHAGERALDRLLAPHGGFDHNAQSLRVVTTLERRYPRFDGLNLTLESLEGLLKHNGPVLSEEPGRLAHALGLNASPAWLFGDVPLLRLDCYASLEAQVAAIADDIAYDTHDIEDAVRAGLLTLADFREAPLAGTVLAAMYRDFPQINDGRAIHELVRRLINLMIGDVIGETVSRLRSAGVRTVEEVYAAGIQLVGFSSELARAEAGLKEFLFERVYRHPAVARPAADGETIVADLFAAYLADPDQLAEGWQADSGPVDPDLRARRVADYVAGMTDRFAITEHRRLFDATPDLG